VHGKIESLSEAAVRYVLTSSLVSTVIPGIKTPTQIEEFVAASDPPYLANEDLAQISELQRRGG
jgi:aryl-alcohol dehydrogenase-like predicted oxidoreductase